MSFMCRYIACNVGTWITEEKVKKRWKSLRDRYVRMRKNLPSGAGADALPKKWAFSSLLTFLEPHIEPRRSVINDIRLEGRLI